VFGSGVLTAEPVPEGVLQVKVSYQYNGVSRAGAVKVLEGGGPVRGTGDGGIYRIDPDSE